MTHEVKQTKTSTARRFGIEPELMPLLRALKGDRKHGRLIELPCDGDLARGFRTWLRRAGVSREELHVATPTRKAITVYDLRGTGITWLAIRGVDPLKIMQRAGHKNFQTTQGYIREAESMGSGFGTPFPALPASLTEAAEVLPPEPAAKQPNSRAKQRRGRDSNPRSGFSPTPA